MNMQISEEEKKRILSKYIDDTSDELLTHMKRHFPVTEIETSFGGKFKFIQVDDKARPLMSNKKYLVGEIFNSVIDDWVTLGEKKIRRTIKKYLDGVMNS
jgi:hypothetical protein